MANKKISRAGKKKTARAATKPQPPAKADASRPSPAARKFAQILAKLSGEERNVQAGRMMSSPGIVCKGKVFAFFWNEDMVFRLGKGFDPATLKVKEWRFLNPFKDKPPMQGWFVVPPAEMSRWERLARAALNTMRAEQEK
ncbi:MAG: hypothetical protein NXI24_01240 [bacterium]|nr:hypothetical protein [bacterium]